MGAAVAVQEQAERPSLFELITVLVICAGLLVGLGALDERAQEREAARATAVLAEQAERAAGRNEREAMTAPSATAYVRTDRVGRESSPIVIPAGPAWGPATSVVSHTQKSEPQASPTPVLQRIDRTRPAVASGSLPVASRPSAAKTSPTTLEGRSAGPILLVLMGLLGLSMVAGGLRLLRQPPVGVTR